MTALARRGSAWAALVAFVASFGLGGTAAGHRDADGDASCEQVELAEGHGRVQFEAVKPSPAATHCAICHWQRAVSGANLAAADGGSFQFQLLGRPVLSGARSPRRAARDQHSSRGPPSQI